MPDIVNRELYSVSPTDLDFAVEIDLNKARQGGRDYFQRGRYAFRITKAQWKPKAGDKPGRNLQIDATCVGPEGCSEIGKLLPRALPAPAGMPDDVEVAERMIADLVASVVSHQGKLQAILDQGGKVKVSPRLLIDKVFAAEVVDDQPYTTKGGTMMQTSKVQRYLTKEEYDARHGVDTSVAQATPTAAVNTGARPNLMEGATAMGAALPVSGGNASGGNKAVDGLIGL